MKEEQLRNELLSLIESLKKEDTPELRKQVSNCLYSLLLIDPISTEYNIMIEYLSDEDILKFINYALENRKTFPDFTINKFDLTFEGELYKTHKEEVEQIYKKVIELYETDQIFVTAKYSFTNCAFMTFNPLLPIKKDISIINKIFIYDFNYLKDYVDEIIDYCNEQHHIFTKKDENFVNLVNDPEKILTRMTFDQSLISTILFIIRGNIKYLNLLLDLHPDYLINQTIFINAHNVSDEELYAFLKRIRDKNCFIELDTTKSDNETLDKIVEIVGDKVGVRPSTPNAAMSRKMYTVKELKKKNEIIDVYANTLSDKIGPNGEVKSLSPFEKFVAAYIITTNFAPYSNTGKDAYEPRSIYEFIDIMVNRPIVCVGYVGFINEILSRNGFKFIGHKWVQTKGKKTVLSANHDVLYTYLKDDKYGIDGFYISDPTNDSIEKDEVPGGKRFKHCLKSYDELLEFTEDYEDPEKDMEISEEKTNLLGRDRNVPNLFDKFRGRIPTDAFIKALCAIHRFTDRNLSMAQTNDISETGYTVEEYNRAALSIEEFDYFIFEEALFDKSYKELYNYFKDTYNLEHYGVVGLMSRMLDKYGIDKYVNMVFGEKVEFYYDFKIVDLSTYKEEDYERIYDYFGENSFTNFPMMRVKLVDFNLDDSFSTALTLKTFDLNKIEEEYKSKAEKVAKGIIK